MLDNSSSLYYREAMDWKYYLEPLSDEVALGMLLCSSGGMIMRRYIL